MCVGVFSILWHLCRNIHVYIPTGRKTNRETVTANKQTYPTYRKVTFLIPVAVVNIILGMFLPTAGLLLWGAVTVAGIYAFVLCVFVFGELYAYIWRCTTSYQSVKSSLEMKEVAQSSGKFGIKVIFNKLYTYLWRYSVTFSIH